MRVLSKNILLILIVFGIVGCASQFYAQTNVYINPLYDNDEKLSYAVRINDVKAAKKFLEAGANPNNNEVMCFVPLVEFEESQCSPPMMAAFLNMNIEMIDLLINAGGNVNYKFPNSDSLLIFAVTENNTDVVLQLLKNGANPNYANTNGADALSLSVANNNPELTKHLLDFGARPNGLFWGEVLHFKSSNEFIRMAWNAINKSSLNQNIIIGNKKQNRFSGNGIILSLSGDRYEGQLKNSQMHGKGKFILASGYIYEGDFVNGELYNGQINTGREISKIVNGKAAVSEAEALAMQRDLKRIQAKRKKASRKAEEALAKQRDEDRIQANRKKAARAAIASKNSQVLEDIAVTGIAIVGFAIMLPLAIVGEILSGDVLHEVAKDLPAAYVENKRQQQLIRNAYIRGANSQRARTPQRQTNQRPCSIPGKC
jgi:hypothetical protein